eukprot:SRR837773.19217.p1 GENE.SRR837773.19217~~SRR837773.19217.p1  ORF type:complete len:149 (-),score=35.21 SRR837773.19217:226-672(-)
MAAMSEGHQTFADAFVARMALPIPGVALASAAATVLTASESLAALSQLDPGFIGSSPVDAVAAAASPRWRLVGRGVTAEWRVSYLAFFEDAACRTPIVAVPRRSDNRDKSFFNGHALSSPARRVNVAAPATAAFVDDASDGRAPRPCP